MVILHCISRSFPILDHRNTNNQVWIVVDHAREDDPVWKTLRFVPGLQHEFLQRVHFLHRCVTKTPVPFNAFLFLQLLLFITYSAFFSHFLEALDGSTALGTVQKTDSENTCTSAVSMLPIGSSRSR